MQHGTKRRAATRLRSCRLQPEQRSADAITNVNVVNSVVCHWRNYHYCFSLRPFPRCSALGRDRHSDSVAVALARLHLATVIETLAAQQSRIEAHLPSHELFQLLWRTRVLQVLLLLLANCRFHHQHPVCRMMAFLATKTSSSSNMRCRDGRSIPCFTCTRRKYRRSLVTIAA